MPKIASKTDWDAVKCQAESGSPIPYDADSELYDPNDEEATQAFLSTAAVRRQGERGPQKSPVKQLVSVRYSPDVVNRFKSTGKGWQARMDKALQDWLKEHDPNSINL